MKDKVNCYTATRTKLMSLLGVGVQTVDYIWACCNEDKLIFEGTEDVRLHKAAENDRYKDTVIINFKDEG